MGHTVGERVACLSPCRLPGHLGPGHLKGQVTFWDCAVMSPPSPGSVWPLISSTSGALGRNSHGPGGGLRRGVCSQTPQEAAPWCLHTGPYGPCRTAHSSPLKHVSSDETEASRKVHRCRCSFELQLWTCVRWGLPERRPPGISPPRGDVRPTGPDQHDNRQGSRVRDGGPRGAACGAARWGTGFTCTSSAAETETFPSRCFSLPEVSARCDFLPRGGLTSCFPRVSVLSVLACGKVTQDRGPPAPPSP